MQVINCLFRIQYEESGWFIYDGDGIKPSTNGSWIYLDDFYEFLNGLMFKAGQTMFRINVIDSKKVIIN